MSNYKFTFCSIVVNTRKRIISHAYCNIFLSRKACLVSTEPAPLTVMARTKISTAKSFGAAVPAGEVMRAEPRASSPENVRNLPRYRPGSVGLREIRKFQGLA